MRAAASARSGAGAAAERDLSAAAALVEELAEDLPEGLREAFLEHPWRRRLLDLSAADGDAAEVSTPPLATPGRRPSRSTGKLVGEDPALLETLAVAERFACSDAPVLIEGQSGTGKELVAELIHRWSPRAGGPLVCVNAAALADTLLLSELFGHERGAFTGADRKRLGKFEVARGGTLFLDEIGDISPAAQAALLRVLQDGTFHRVGGTSLVRSDARVIVATNRDLKALVAEGRFRLDLYYRVASLSLELPPLRERKGDIPALCRSLLRDIVGPEREVRVEPAAVRVLAAQDWPGNVRELRNVLERLVHLCEGDTITASMVRRFGVDLGGAKAPEPVEKPAFVELEPGPGFSLKRAQRQLELDLITKALERSEGNIAAAARLLGMTRPMLSRKIKDYGLKRGTP